MLANLKDVLADAKARRYAVGAFNGTTLESVRAIIAAAEELGCPVILQHAQSHDGIVDMHEIAVHLNTACRQSGSVLRP